jgi:copper chaperone CopZ
VDCAACPLIAKQSLAHVPGGRNVVVSYARRKASMTFDDPAAMVPALIEVTTRAGDPSRWQV